MEKEVGLLKQSIKPSQKRFLYQLSCMCGTNRYMHTCLKCFVLHRLLRLILRALEIVMATTYFFTNGTSIVNRHIKPPCSLTIMLLKLACPPSRTNRSKGVSGLWKIHTQGKILLTVLSHTTGQVKESTFKQQDYLLFTLDR